MVVLEVSEPQVTVVGATLRVEVSLKVEKGTYVRSLAEELGRRLGLPCHLGGLRRTGCGELALDDPRTLHGLAVEPTDGEGIGVRVAAIDPEAIVGRLVPDENAVPLQRVQLPGDELGLQVFAGLLKGQQVAVRCVPGLEPGAVGHRAVVAPGGGLVIARVEAGFLRPERVVIAPA
jgi:tRNA pseudouridine55 synthase